MQIKITMKYHLTLVTVAIIKKKKKKAVQRINTAEDVQKRESSYSLSGNVNCEATVEKAWRFLETLNTEVSYDPAISLPSLDVEKVIIRNDMCPSILGVALFTVAKPWNPPKRPLTEKWRPHDASTRCNTT